MGYFFYFFIFFVFFFQFLESRPQSESSQRRISLGQVITEWCGKSPVFSDNKRDVERCNNWKKVHYQSQCFDK